MLVSGAGAPPFRLSGIHQDQVKEFRLTDDRGRWVVLFFYPEDFSFICPTEVIGFQKGYPEFQALGCEVVGISVDPLETHQAWVKELQGIDYPLLSDPTREVCRRYLALDEGTGRAVRATYIIDPEGLLQYGVFSHRNVGRSVEETLRVLKGLQTGRQCPEGWRPGGPTAEPGEG